MNVNIIRKEFTILGLLIVWLSTAPAPIKSVVIKSIPIAPAPTKSIVIKPVSTIFSPSYIHLPSWTIIL